MGAVVHTDNSQRYGTSVVPLQQQSRHLTHGGNAAFGARGKVRLGKLCKFTAHIRQGVALFGDGKADHLQGGAAENFLQPGVVLGIGGVSPESSRHGADESLLRSAVRHKVYQKAQIIKGGVGCVHDLIVKGFGNKYAALDRSLLQQSLLQVGGKSPEQVPRAEVHPGGILGGFGPGRGNVIAREPDSRCLPAGTVTQICH